MLINKDFKEFIEQLNDHNVQYLIVGGYAVAFHGHPRYTKDLDVWVLSESKNITGILNALSDFGFADLDLQFEDFKDPDQIIQLGYPPNRIDLMTKVDGVDFRKCYRKREEIEIDGVKVNFIDLASLKENKRASGRHQDLADLENLE